jgi:hypothetical protein
VRFAGEAKLPHKERLTVPIGGVKDGGVFEINGSGQTDVVRGTYLLRKPST